MSIPLAIVLIILFGLIFAGIAGFVAYNKGRTTGKESEQQRQNEMRMGAEEQAAHIIATAETKAKQMQLSAKEEEVKRRNEMDAEQDRRRQEVARIEERLQSRSGRG